MYLSFGLDEDTGVQFHNVLHKHGLNVGRQCSDLGVKQGVDGTAGIGQETAEFPRDPRGCVENLAYPVLVGAPREEVSVLQNSGL